jgi:hypothetical protein
MNFSATRQKLELTVCLIAMHYPKVQLRCRILSYIRAQEEVHTSTFNLNETKRLYKKNCISSYHRDIIVSTYFITLEPCLLPCQLDVYLGKKYYSIQVN